MSAIGKNIKKIRKYHKLNQTEFANLFGLSRANIGSYEEERAEPKIDAVIKIAKHYNIDLETIITKELKINDLANINNNIHLDNLKESHHTQQDGNKIPFVRLDQNDEYIFNYKKGDFLSELNFLRLPLPENIQSRGFQISHSQCLFKNYDHHNDDIFVVSSVNKKFLNNIPEEDQYILVTSKGIFATEIHYQNEQLVISQNDHLIHLITADELLEVWRIIGVYKTQFVLESTNHDGNKLHELESRIARLEQRL